MTADEQGWCDAALTLDMALHDLLRAETLTEVSEAAIEVSNARHALRTWLPGYDYDTGTLPWERDMQ